MTVAALYIDERGVYPKMPDVECWGVERDARLYAGPWSVIAHPPCGPWGELRHLYKGNEHDCAGYAIAAVRKFGGVMEHPHKSKFWAVADTPAPGSPLDEFGGFTVDVDQVSWGHVARKRTRLYFVRVPRARVTTTMRTGGTPTHWVSGSRNPNQRGGSVPPGIKVCSAEQRRRTPPAFAEWLVMLARSASGFSARRSLMSSDVQKHAGKIR